MQTILRSENAEIRVVELVADFLDMRMKRWAGEKLRERSTGRILCETGRRDRFRPKRDCLKPVHWLLLAPCQYLSWH
jgi:hypothetical protein